MQLNRLVIIYMLLLFGAFSASAQEVYWQNGAIENENNQLGKPVSLLEDSAADTIEPGVEESSVLLENIDPNISYYVQNLNLSAEQLEKAKEISETGLQKKAELLQQVRNLRAEAYKLEAASLFAFEAILTDTQKAAFRELRNNVNAADGNEVKPSEENWLAEDALSAQNSEETIENYEF